MVRDEWLEVGVIDWLRGLRLPRSTTVPLAMTPKTSLREGKADEAISAPEMTPKTSLREGKADEAISAPAMTPKTSLREGKADEAISA